MNVVAAFTLVKVDLRRRFNANCGFPFLFAATMGAGTGINGVTLFHGVLHSEGDALPAVWFKLPA